MAITDRPAPDRSASDEDRLEAAILWKVSLRLLPFLFVLYVMNILDRINVGFAKLQMLGDLGMNGRVYAMGAGIFYVGYFLFEVPSNLMLRRVGARRWIARILISWGLISAAMLFIKNAWSFYLLRFLLGFAEAGFFPGIILYLSYWFPARQRAKAVARFMTGSAVTGIIGNPLSGFIMDHMDKVADLRGWQWLFLFEGLPSALLGIMALCYLTDGPELAGWLPASERDWLAERMRREEKHREARHGQNLLQTMANPRVWLLCLLYVTVAMGSNSFGLYLPTLIKGQFPGASTFRIGLLAAVPSIATMVTMVLLAMHSDHTGERRWHVAGSAFLAALGWFLLVRVRYLGLAPRQEGLLVLVALAVTQMGTLSMLAPFWSLPTSFLSGAAAAGGIAFINSVGNLGGFLGPYVMGEVEAATGTFDFGFMILGSAMILGGILAIRARHDASVELRPGEATLPEGKTSPAVTVASNDFAPLANAVRPGSPPRAYTDGLSPTPRNDEV